MKIFHKRRDLWICLTLFAVTLAIYWPVHVHDFIGLDDDEYVTENIHVRNGFTPANVRWAFTSVAYAVNWHPLTWLSHMLDCQLFGLNPGAPHIINVLLHVANAVALFLVLNRMTGSPSRTGNVWQSAFVAALFALHPLHVESVAWVSERKDVLSGLFWMLTMGAYVVYAEKRSVWRYGLVLIFFTLGLMAKPMLVTLPCVLLLLDWWPLRRGPAFARGYGGASSEQRTRFTAQGWGKLVMEKVPLLFLSAVSSFLTLYSQQTFAAVPTSVLPVTLRLQHSIAALMIYLEKNLTDVLS